MIIDALVTILRPLWLTSSTLDGMHLSRLRNRDHYSSELRRDALPVDSQRQSQDTAVMYSTPNKELYNIKTSLFRHIVNPQPPVPQSDSIPW